MCIKQGIYLGVLGKGLVFIPNLLLSNFLICAYLNYLTFNYKISFTLNFNTLLDFYFLISVLNQEDVN
jgi:hypothetical protein